MPQGRLQELLKVARQAQGLCIQAAAGHAQACTQALRGSLHAAKLPLQYALQAGN
jgi:hypothetical protein